MRASPALANRSRAAGALLVLLALLLRFAVPTGYMLAGDGSLAIVPCPSAAPLPPAMPAHEHMHMAMPMAPDGGAPADSHPADHASQVCPFATLSSPVLPPESPLLTLAERLPFTELIVPAAPLALAPALAAPPPPSRGPPLLS